MLESSGNANIAHQTSKEKLYAMIQIHKRTIYLLIPEIGLCTMMRLNIKLGFLQGNLDSFKIMREI